MLRTTFLAAALFLAPVAALASGDHYRHGDRYDTTSRIVVAEPRIAVSIGGSPFNGFNLFYQSGGYPYAAVAPYYYAPVVVREPYYPAYRVQHHHSRNNWRDEGRHHRNGDRHRGRGRDD